MTEKLFYEDGYLKEFRGTVLSCTKDQKEGQYKVVLDRSTFFPEGGGQYGDTGWLDDVEVLDTQEKDGVIWHRTNAPLTEGQEITGKLNWEQRFDKMQQHTGEHIVSGIVHKWFGYNNVGFHLGDEVCTMDFDGEISREQLEKIEWEANRAVVENVEVLVSYPSKKELGSLEYRSKIEIEGAVRIITIPGYDVCACCAPHVTRTGEIGVIKLTGVQRYKGGVRMTLLCGFRALKDYGAKEGRAARISHSLCAKETEIDEAVERLKEERDRWKEECKTLQKQLILSKLPEVRSGELICLFRENLKPDEMRAYLNGILDQGAKCCLIISEEQPDSGRTSKENTTAENEENTEQKQEKQSAGFRYIAGSRTLNMRPVAEMLNHTFDGRGGGKPDMVQGSCKNSAGKEQIRQILEAYGRKETGVDNADGK